MPYETSFFQSEGDSSCHHYPVVAKIIALNGENCFSIELGGGIFWLLNITVL